MASQSDVHIVSVNIAALNNDYRPIFEVPDYAGGITIVGANIVQEGAATQSLYLIDAGAAGTAAGGTLVTWGSQVFAAGVPKAGTISTSDVFVDAGDWVAVKEANVGTTNAITIVSVAYVMGRAAY